MLTAHDVAVLAHWRTVRANAIEACRLLPEHVEHDMPGLVAHADKAIAELEAKADAPETPHTD